MSLATLKTKVEKLIEKINRYKWLKDNVTGVSFNNNQAITSVTLDCANMTTLEKAFGNCRNLNAVYLSNTQNVQAWNYLLGGSQAVYTLETLDFSSATGINAQTWNNWLQNLKVVPETIKRDFTVLLTTLTTESIQSIFDGLATVTSAQTLTLHANAKILQSQVDSANAKGWTVAGGTVVSEEEYYG